MTVYEQLLVVAIALVSLVVIHQLVLMVWRWRWPEGERQLPRLLVFPRLEIVLATTTVVGVSEAFGALVSTQIAVPAVIRCDFLTYPIKCGPLLHRPIPQR